MARRGERGGETLNALRVDVRVVAVHVLGSRTDPLSFLIDEPTTATAKLEE
jgi:hypothetical protein